METGQNVVPASVLTSKKLGQNKKGHEIGVNDNNKVTYYHWTNSAIFNNNKAYFLQTL